MTIDSIWKLANSGWFGLLVGTVLGVAGIVIGLILDKRNKQFAALRYLIDEGEVIGPGVGVHADDLAITFRDVIVPRVSRATIGIWNAGTTTIRGADIVEDEPLRFLLKTGRILRANITTIARPSNKVSLIEGESFLGLSFDYLEPGDGARFEVIHSGPLRALNTTGAIRGVPLGLELADIHNVKRRVGKLGEYVAALLVIGIVGFGVVKGGIALWDGSWRDHKAGTGVVSFFLGFLVVSIIMDVRGKKREPRRFKDVPKVISDDEALTRYRQ